MAVAMLPEPMMLMVVMTGSFVGYGSVGRAVLLACWAGCRARRCGAAPRQTRWTGARGAALTTTSVALR
jgi:hypothetical protein